MPAYTYLGTYALTTTDNMTFTLAFSIPDNCTYHCSGSSGNFLVTISLNSGQATPSTNFAPQTATFAASRGGVQVDFLQPDQKGVQRPKIVIESM